MNNNKCLRQENKNENGFLKIKKMKFLFPFENCMITVNFSQSKITKGECIAV